MTLPQIISRNQIQKTNKRVLPLVNDVLQPTTWYTCPTGKIAIVKGTCVCDDVGAAGSTFLQFAGVTYALWAASGGGTDINILGNLAPGVTIPFEAKLDSDDTIITDQDTGTNAKFKLQATIEEFNI